jgi:hypothetical protein
MKRHVILTAMEEYSIDPATYFDLVRDAEFAAVEQPMSQMISRYRLQGLAVLALGPRWGREEYWLWKAGCTLTLVDIDEAGDIEPRLQACPTGDLTYMIGDAFSWRTNSRYDVIYTSGFGPQEIRRANMQLNAPWPKEADFYHGGVMEMCRRLLKPGGLYINQSYYAGPALNDDIIASMQRQLSEARLPLVEIHAWRDMPAVHLDVAGFVNPSGSPISTIHGRSPLTGQTVTRLFPKRAEARTAINRWASTTRNFLRSWRSAPHKR